MNIKSSIQVSITDKPKYQLVFSTTNKPNKISNFISDLKSEYHRLISEDVHVRLT